MSSTQNHRNYIEMIGKRVKLDWDDKEMLNTYKEDVENLKRKFGYFNRTSAFIGLALTHTYVIYTKKTILSAMEKNAWKHIRNCVGVSLISGYLVGYLYGNSVINTRKTNKLTMMIDNRLSELK